jgi:hypothetical protein
MNEDSISKIAENTAERLFKSREPELKRAAEESARLIALSIVGDEVSSASESIKKAAEDRAKEAAVTAINQIVPEIKGELTPQINSLISSAIKELDRKIDLIKKDSKQSTEDPQVQKSNLNYSTVGIYQGDLVGFALNGQVLTISEKNQYGEINKIIFGNVPDGITEGDILYWDGEKWEILSRPIGEGIRVLSIEETGAPFWSETEDCEEE